MANNLNIMNPEQKKAVELTVEAVAKQHFNGVHEMQIVLYRAMLTCVEEVLSNPEKYGLQPKTEWVSERNKAMFWSKVKDNGYCWEWGGSLNKDGYGNFRLGNKQILSHRFSYQVVNGLIYDNLHVLHKCDNPSCVNPDHLFLGTHKDNMIDKQKKGRSRNIGRSSKFIGVGFRHDSLRWRAYVMKDGGLKHIGCFKTEVEAAKARNEYIINNRLDTPLNDIPEPPTETK